VKNRNRWLVVTVLAVLVVALAAGSALAFGFGERKMERPDLTEDQHQLLESVRERFESLIQPLREELREAREALDWERFGMVSAALAQLRHEMMAEMAEVIPFDQLACGHRRCEQDCEDCTQIQQRSHRWTRLMPRRGR